MTSIGLDLGTGAIKGVCWNQQKGILHKISERVSFAHPAPDHAELDPRQYREQVLQIIDSLAGAAEEKISGISFAAASGNTLLCTQKGAPLTSIISWLDKRLKDWLPPEQWQVRKTTGWPAIPTFPLMHLEYFRRTDPELLKNAVVAMNNDYLTWYLCGEHVLDNSNAAPFYFWDQENNTPAPYLDYYGLTPSQLPRIGPTGTTAGTLKKEFCKGNLTPETRIVAGSFDHPAGARAVNVLAPGSMLLSCGTSWVGFYPCRNRRDVPERELCDTFQSGSGGCWGAMFSVAAVGVEIENFICERYGSSSDRYEMFNDEALQGDTPAREKMLEVIRRFKERFQQHSGVSRIVLSGGPSEGKAWHKFLEKELRVAVEVSPWHSYTGAVGAAQTAGDICR